jgi:hypothetical protein
MSTTSALSITKFLTSPMRVAHALDWKKVSGAVLSLHIGKDSIDLAVTSHPEASSSSSLLLQVQPLPSIPLKTTRTVKNSSSNNKKCNSSSQTRTLHPCVVEELHDLVEDWDVCGFVVSWPVQKEGRCGAMCGRVLYTLDQIVAADWNNKRHSSGHHPGGSHMFNHGRPVCLWDSKHIAAAAASEDDWGRSASYGQVTINKSIHYASVEQYQDDGAIAAEIAADYMRHFFPATTTTTTTTPQEHHMLVAQQQSKKKTTAAIPSASRAPSPPPRQFDIAWLDAAGEQTDAYCAAL